MTWKYFGKRRDNILGKCLKIISWSTYLKEELGIGFSEFIMVSSGEQYVQDEEWEKVENARDKEKANFEYIEKMGKTSEEINLLVKENKFEKALEKMMQQLAYFYIAKIDADNMYESASKQEKKRIEAWRNDKHLFDAWDQAIEKFAKKLGVSIKQLDLHTLDEVKERLKGKNVNEKEIYKRKVWSLKLKNNKVEVVLKDLTPIKEEIKEDEVIEGQAAFVVEKPIRGIVGKEILVKAMTTPNMIHEMINKKAIVTDEGGMLCHAAIVCREFKIPGIVGTRVATKLLKVGDNVEVDTKKGTVKKLK